MPDFEFAKGSCNGFSSYANAFRDFLMGQRYVELGTRFRLLPSNRPTQQELSKPSRDGCGEANRSQLFVNRLVLHGQLLDHVLIGFRVLCKEAQELVPIDENDLAGM